MKNPIDLGICFRIKAESTEKEAQTKAVLLLLLSPLSALALNHACIIIPRLFHPCQGLTLMPSTITAK